MIADGEFDFKFIWEPRRVILNDTDPPDKQDNILVIEMISTIALAPAIAKPLAITFLCYKSPALWSIEVSHPRDMGFKFSYHSEI